MTSIWRWSSGQLLFYSFFVWRKWPQIGGEPYSRINTVHQGFGFENGRRVINRSPWVGKGSCRRVKNHSLSVFQESYSDYHKMNLNASPWNLLVLQISKSTDHMHR